MPREVYVQVTVINTQTWISDGHSTKGLFSFLPHLARADQLNFSSTQLLLSGWATIGIIISLEFQVLSPNVQLSFWSPK